MRKNNLTLVKVIKNSPNSELPSLDSDTPEFYVRVRRVGKQSELVGKVMGLEIVRERIINGGVTDLCLDSYIIVETKGDFKDRAEIKALYSARGKGSIYRF